MSLTDSPPIDLAIVGAGPCGIAAAIAAGRAGLRAVVFDAGPVVNSITQYPTYATFFSTAEKLSLGGVPFVIAGEKPTRRDALAYYRAVVRHFAIDVRQFEAVSALERDGDRGFRVRSRRHAGGDERVTPAANVLVATGYWGSPNWLNVPGERLPHVTHAYREGHESFMQDAVVVGGGNSAAEAALDLWRSGARVTLVHFGPTFDMKIKPWVLPDFNNRVAEGSITARWNRRVVSVDAEAVTVRPSDGSGENGGEERIRADHVYLMTGFKPNVALLENAGVPMDPATGIPAHDPETLETVVPHLFIAGVVVAGYDANKVFIENGRFHGDKVVARILGRPAPAAPLLSRELDT
jgi:thioredoxin reductase (NADPH)